MERYHFEGGITEKSPKKKNLRPEFIRSAGLRFREISHRFLLKSAGLVAESGFRLC